ncbi:MAG: hypothetical protein IIB15_06725, partial [Chloroflexi bacterium]|nr:hypothetical protein [Chloroflexota bacterium]
MEDKTALTLDEIKEELRRFPASVLEELEKARESMPDTMTDAQGLEWGRSGLEIAQQTVRSWEAAAQYYRVSPQVITFMPFNYFIKWTECGSVLCKESPTLATAYFVASPGAMGKLRSRHIETWSKLGRSLYKGTWKSSTLACKFFESSSALLENLSFQELEQFVAFLDSLSHRSYDLASECLQIGQQLFPLIGNDKAAL